MFGVVPKEIWKRTNPADDQNRCTWAIRCMLIEDGNRLILIDTGIGNKQSEKFFSHYQPHGNDTLIDSIEALGYSPKDISDVFLTHLHFDHVGGAVTRSKQNSEKLTLTFPNATYWSNPEHWHWATHPNAREKASFLAENILPIKEAGQLKMIDGETDNFNELPFEVRFVNGHTERQMLPLIECRGRKILYAADLFPSVSHIPAPYIMSYDVRPLKTVEEKTSMLEEIFDENYIVFFEHDPEVECCTLKKTEKGYSADNIFKLSDIK